MLDGHFFNDFKLPMNPKDNAKETPRPSRSLYRDIFPVASK